MKTSSISQVGQSLCKRIDHTLLKPDAALPAVEQLCREAADYQFASVCVHPCRVAAATKLLQGSGVLTCTVVGFPLGSMVTNAKAFETRQAIEDGADEIDMVLAVWALKDGDTRAVLDDIRAVVEAAQKRTVKVILETCLLTHEEKRLACELAVKAGAHFVKTSTGFAGGGATVEDIRLMRQVVGPELGVKASGGIRTQEDALAMVNAGASRIGASASVAIVSA